MTGNAAKADLQEAAVAAAGRVLEPSLGEPLATFDLIRSVSVRRAGRVQVEVGALSSDDDVCAHLRAAVDRAVYGVPDVADVDVRTVPLSSADRASLGTRLRAASSRPGAFGSTTRCYAIGSGKGGVGKSSLTANLAVALARTGQRVAVLDADVWGFSQPQLFGVRNAPLAIGGMMLPVPAHGVRLMSMGFFVADDEPVVWRGPMLQKALEQFLADVYWGSLDVLLVDLPPGTGDVPLTISSLLPDAALVVVTTPQDAAVQVAARAGRMALDNRMPVAGVAENMAGSVFGAGGGERLADMLHCPLLGSVPLDEQIRLDGDAGTPALVGHPDSPAAQAIQAIAHALPTPRRSLVGRPLPLFV